MSKRKRTVFITVWVLALIAVLAAALAIGPTPKSESVQGAMRDAVLHGDNQISLFGLKSVNPALISGFTVTALLLIFAALVRVLVIPRFTLVPGKFQLVLEELVQKNFDLRPAGIIRMLDLRRPIYAQTAAYGHFGRTDIDLPWEHTDKAEALKQQAGI